MSAADSFVDRVLDRAAEIQKIPAPTHHESARASFVAEKFRQEGVTDVEVDSTGNVIGRVPGSRGINPVILSAHLDTVFPVHTDLTLRKEGDRWYGPGLGDNSLGVAGLFGALWGMREQGIDLSGDLWLVANTGEEGLGNLRGMKALVERFGPEGKAFIILEGMAYGKVYNQSLGVRRLRIRCLGPGGHSWMDFGKPSAIHCLAEVIAKLSSLTLSTNPRTTLNVGRVSGGTSVNTIAAEASMELDLRSGNPQTLDDLADGVMKILSSEIVPAGLRIEVEEIGARPAGAISESHPLVMLAAAAIERQGDTAEVTLGSTDANVPHSLGLPAICIGLTRGGAAHTTDEFIFLEPLRRGLEQLLEVIARAHDW